MRFSTVLSGAALIQTTIAGYVLEDDYMKDFFGGFEFFTEADPTEGFVKFVDQATATEMGLIHNNNSTGTYSNSTASAISWGVDSTNKTPEGRPSIRMSSKKSYNNALVVLDIEHMPVGCGTWPAFWMLGPDWPHKGEIDILEGVNEQEVNAMTLHTGPGCAISADQGLQGAFTGETITHDCDVAAEDQAKNAGCSIEHPSEKSYGTGLNANKGGVYATQWTDDHISVFFFPRGEIPEDVLGDSPDPSSWGKPAAKFEGGCDIPRTFKDQQIIFDTTFCGVWAGRVWEDGSCAKKAKTCEEYVRDNPEAFTEAFWTVNALKVYQDSAEAPAPSSSGYPMVSSSIVALPSVVPSETAIATSNSTIVAPTLTSATLIPTSGSAIYSTVVVSVTVTETPFVPFPTPINGTIPSTALAPPATFTSEYSGIAPSEILSSTPTPIESSIVVSSETAAPAPTGGVDNGPMGGFKWPGAVQNKKASRDTDGNVAGLAVGNETAVVPVVSSATPATSAAASAAPPAQTGSGGPMGGFKWPSGGAQRPGNGTSPSISPSPVAPVTSSTTISIATTSAAVVSSQSGLPASDAATSVSSSSVVAAPVPTTDSSTTVALTTPTPIPSASEPSTPTESCSMDAPASLSSTPSVTEIVIPIPTGGVETIYETVFVTIDPTPAPTPVSSAAPTPPARRLARQVREQRRRITRHHAKI